MNRSDLTSPAAIKRLIACLAGSFVLALMWGPQEGVQEDYGYAFRQAIFSPRILVFLGWLHWTEFIVTVLLGGVAIARRDRRLAWIAAALCVVSGVIAVVAHQEVVSKGVASTTRWVRSSRRSDTWSW